MFSYITSHFLEKATDIIGLGPLQPYPRQIFLVYSSVAGKLLFGSKICAFLAD